MLSGHGKNFIIQYDGIYIQQLKKIHTSKLYYSVPLTWSEQYHCLPYLVALAINYLSILYSLERPNGCAK